MPFDQQRPHVTANDRGPAINVVAWVCMVVMILTVIAKVWSKLVAVRKLHLDDYLALSALTFAVGQTISISIAVDHGLGKRTSMIPSDQFESLSQALYASPFLFIASLALSKLTAFSFVRVLIPLQRNPSAVWLGITATFLWAFTAIMVIAFQCEVPRTWDVLHGSHCIDQGAFWTCIATLSAAIDIMLVALPIYALRDLYVSPAKKAGVMSAFALRLLCIPLSLLRIYYLNKAHASTPPDLPYTLFATELCTSAEMNLSIVVTVFPFLKRFIERMEAGVFQFDLRRAPLPTATHEAKRNFSLAHAAHSNSEGKSDRRDSKSSIFSISRIFKSGRESWSEIDAESQRRLASVSTQGGTANLARMSTFTMPQGGRADH